MRFATIGAVTALALATCAPAINVQTAISPDVDLRPLRSFRLLPPPAPRDRSPLDAEHPMLENSITNRELRRAITAALHERGYRVDERGPDFAVAYYASAKHKLDVTSWNYGYPLWPRWWRGWGRRGTTVVTEYTEGTVIIDVLNPSGQELWWRGRGVAVVSDDVQEYLDGIRETVSAILEEFPLATTVVAGRARER